MIFTHAKREGIFKVTKVEPEFTTYGLLNEYGRVDKIGFAWVVVRPGNGHFARWARKYGKGRAGYGGGLHIWVREFNQSITRKEAYAIAFAEILREAGVRAFSDSRLD